MLVSSYIHPFFTVLLLVIVQALNQHRNCSIYTNSKKEITVNCRGLSLRGLPAWLPSNTSELDISYNDFNDVKNKSFLKLKQLRKINLAHCKIKQLEEDAFESLSMLEFLDMSSNLLRLAYVPEFVFKPLVLLETLDLKDNLFFIDKAYPGKALSHLTNLQYLSLEMYNGLSFGDGFQNLSKFNKLRLVSSVEQIYHLGNDTFSGLSLMSLKYLNLTLNQGYLVMDHGIFCGCKSLHRLTIQTAHRSDALKMILKSLYGIQHQRMEILDLRRNNRIFNLNPVSLNVEDVTYLNNICVDSLNLANNQLALDENFSKVLMSLRSNTCVRSIDVSSNVYNYDYSWLLILLTAFDTLQDIRADIIKRLRSAALPKYLPNNSKLKNITNFNKDSQRLLKIGQNSNTALNFNVSPNITNIYASFLDTTGTVIPNVTIRAENLQRLIISYSQLIFVGQLRGMKKLTFLDISGSNCSDMSIHLIKNLTSLQTLEMSETRLAEGLKKDLNGEFLEKLMQLSIIKFSNNELVTLNPGLFKDQYGSLQQLYLDRNKFVEIPIDFSKFVKLEYLDLSSNVITGIDKKQRKHLDNLVLRIKEFEINLSGNMLFCSCAKIDFLKWLDKTKLKLRDWNNTQCVDQNGQTRFIKDVVENLDTLGHQCVTSFWLIFAAVGISSLVIGLLLSVLGYRYRFCIEYNCLRVRMLLRRYKPVTEEYEFDAFVAYSNLDYSWVVQELYRHLEEEFSICLYDKDFIPGQDITTNIITAIDRSRKVIFVVTKNLLDSHWGNYEMEMTRMHAFQKGRDNMVIIIIKGDLSVSDMPQVLKSFWSKVVCLTWPDNSTAEMENVLWMKLKNALSH